MHDLSLGRAIIIVLDGVGVGEMPDAASYGDQGSNSVSNVARRVGGLELPNLQALGLGNITPIDGVPAVERAAGCFGKMSERSAGKDTTTGHWEISGVVLESPFPVYPQGFPGDVITAFSRKIGREVLGNRPASGSAIIQELGARHLRTGYPIVYTSADSVFQIAAHEDVISVDELYEMCHIARELLQGEHGVGRVIARPFTGSANGFTRTPRRRDFSLDPPRDTILDVLSDREYGVTSVGKIKDIFVGRGITQSYPAANNDETISQVLQALRDQTQPGLIFANCIDFDMVWGHRNDPIGYAGALETFDQRLPEIQEAMSTHDILILVGDHGCDPTTDGTDHTREYTPLLVWGEQIQANIDLGCRNSFSDVAATLAEWFDVSTPGPGASFADILRERV